MIKTGAAFRRSRFTYMIRCISSLLRRVFMPTLSTMPTQRYIITTLDPPAEKNGSVTPMTGSTFRDMVRLDGVYRDVVFMAKIAQ